MNNPTSKDPAQDWRIDTSAGRPILVYKNCSVIEAEQAEYVLRLVAADQASAPVADERVPLEALDYLVAQAKSAASHWHVDQRAAIVRAALASAPVAEPETMEEIHRRERERAPWVLPKDPTLPESAPVAGEAQRPRRPGATLSMDGATLHVQRDGSAQIIVAEDDFTLEDDRNEGPDGPQGSVHWVACLAASELIALRDFLTGHSRPSDDALWDQTLTERDEYHDMADKLANAIADHLMVEIGEHSSGNCPWMRALGAIENAAPHAGAEDWTPTADSINALPARIRDYIHSLVANTDPAGMVAENTMLRDQTKQLDAMIGRQKKELDEARQEMQPAAIGALPGRDPDTPVTQQGLFDKYLVQRRDGSDLPGRKHFGCRYFVLDIDHDPFSKIALAAYSLACEARLPTLAADLRRTASIYLEHLSPGVRGLVQRLIHHGNDKTNTAFSRSTMREAAAYLSATWNDAAIIDGYDTAWELSFQWGGDDDVFWAIHRREGSVNDREYVLYARGDTIREAIQAAIERKNAGGKDNGK